MSQEHFCEICGASSLNVERITVLCQEVDQLKEQVYGDGGLVQEVADLQAKGERVEQERDEILSQLDAASALVKQIGAERDDYKRQLDWAHDVLDKIGAPRFPNDYPCSPEQDSYRGRDTGGAYLVHGRIATYVDQANEKLEAAQKELDVEITKRQFAEQQWAANVSDANELIKERDAALARVKELEAERDAALVRVQELEQELRTWQGCPNCWSDHAPDSICPPHEVRPSGFEAIRVPYRRRIAKLEADCAVMREFVSAARDWEEPKEDARDWKVKHERYYLYLKKSLALMEDRSPRAQE